MRSDVAPIVWLICITGCFAARAGGFLIGGCIGPRNVFERYLSSQQKKQLQVLIDNEFNGQNQEKVLQDAYLFLRSRLSVAQWNEIIPEIRDYRSLGIDCSPYTQLLSPFQFQILLASVREAEAMGAQKVQIKALVDDFVKEMLRDDDSFGARTFAQPKVEESPKPLFPIARPSFAGFFRQ